jgi:hypothetical protein
MNWAKWGYGRKRCYERRSERGGATDAKGWDEGDCKDRVRVF